MKCRWKKPLILISVTTAFLFVLKLLSGNYGASNETSSHVYKPLRDVMSESQQASSHDKESQINNSEGRSSMSRHKDGKNAGLESNFIGMIRSNEEKLKRKEGNKKHAFNVLISDRIGNHREIPDTRHPLCKKGDQYEKLPSASIIVCFFNEAFSTLLRTVYSILDRTDRKLLKEIILIDDSSTDIDMKYKLNKYINEHFGTDDAHQHQLIKLLRTPERHGLMKARNFGVNHASGDVIVFLDSHIEVNVKWLEPLIQRINENRTRVVCPVIDVINAETFEYTASPIVKGGFNWGLHFTWDSVPGSMLKTKADFIKPIPSPTMAGGLFAMDRKYFSEMGAYDKGMDIWGGENLEMSFRIWMCGGSLEIIPCSRVGHVFRSRRPYGSPTGEDTLTKNTLRLVNVWMDEYKKYYLQTRPDAINMAYGDVTDRIELRKKLRCQSFDWYVKNVYPELKPPSQEDSAKRKIKMKSMLKKDKSSASKKKVPYVLGRYQIQLADTDLCIESEAEVTKKGSNVILAKCLAIKRQLWSETEKSELRLADYLCLDADSEKPYLGKCHEMGASQDWKYSAKIDTPIYSESAGMCLGVAKEKIGSVLLMSICSSDQAKKWNLISRVPIFP